ncbi:MAG: response regulator transcription factor [Anaerolineae bacterium]|nr:response regulator transcription factor [Anaerolineae bacterium]MDW8100288.1 response regulator transcription factor [Anaerolineae bacterium]
MREATILTVDDDPNLLRFLEVNLTRRGFQVIQASNGAEALEKFATQVPDLIILDLMMPEVDGWTVCRKIREISIVPIIVLSARGDEDGKVEALYLGADDYLTKPFGVQELLARVHAVLRRSTPAALERRISDRDIRLGPLKIDGEKHRVEWKGQSVHLTPTEYSLLYELASNAPRVLSHSELLTKIWGPEYEGAHHYVHIYVGRLRAKLGEQAIITTPGIGYRFGIRPLER